MKYARRSSAIAHTFLCEDFDGESGGRNTESDERGDHDDVDVPQLYNDLLLNPSAREDRRPVLLLPLLHDPMTSKLEAAAMH